jgi:MOSC domain-containing protein YiiM
MKVLSVNTGSARPVSGRPSPSGIDKRPRTGRVAVGPLGLEGDTIVDLVNHGGEDQAVYLYSREDYAFWERELGRALPDGLFGENLSVEGLESGDVAVGERFACGSLLLEVTSPRIPCSTFAAHVGVSDLPARFMAARRPGVYCRVLAEGDVGTGDVFAVTPYRGERVTLADLVETYPHKRISEETRSRYLSVPLHRKLAAYLRGEVDRP